MTVSGTSIKIYKDGILYATSTTDTLPTYSEGNGLGIGCFHYGGGNIYPYCGSLNDFRIYNHCLSAKEVKEISKGLVCHYKLSGVGGENLVQNSQLATSWATGDVLRCNSPTGYSFDGECIKITSGTSGNDNNGYGILLRTSDISYSVGEKLTFSMDIKGSGKHIGLWFLGTDGNWWTGTNFHTYLTQYNDWTRVSVTGTVPSGAPRVMLGLHTGLSNNTLYAKNMKLERSSVQTPWCPNPSDALYSTLGYNDGIEYDCSGYGNHGTKVGNIVWSGDTARYSGSYMLTTNSSYISTTLNTSGYANSYTFSYWAKISDMNMKMAFGFSDGNRLNLYPTNSIFCWNTGDSADNPFQNSGTNVTFASYNGAWHHYTITGNGTTTTLYIDGEKKGTAKAYRAITGTKLFLSGWNTETPYKWTGGNISDFRIYATALSESDVKSLYNVSASIDKTGVLSAYEFIEET